MADLQIDLTASTMFLDALGGSGAIHTFQTFDDDEKRKRQRKPRPELVSQCSGTSTGSHMVRHSRLNSNGAGVFAVINQTDGRGAKKENVTHIRAYYADIDRKIAKGAFTVDDVKAELVGCPPSMIVETPNGWHLYWIMERPEPCGENERNEAEALLRRIQRALAKYGADPAVCTANRVLRLPGFYHCKAEPTLVRLLEVNEYRYTREALRTAFPDIEADRPKRNDIEAPRPRPDFPDDAAMIQGACRYAYKLPPSIEGQNGSRDLFNAALKLLDKFALSVQETFDVLATAFNPRCEPPWSDGELRRAVHRAAKVVGVRP